MKVAISDIKDKMSGALLAKNYKPEEIDFIIEMYLGGELKGHTSHGLASFPSFVQEDFSKLPKPEVTKQTNALFMIDAKSNPGVIVGKAAADEAIKRAKKEGVGIAIIKDMESWLRPGAIAEYIASKDLLSVVTNSGGGSSVAPPGGYDAVLGTNPIAYGIPTSDKPLVVDMATAKHAWGQVRLANKYGTNLPMDSFYDDKGEITLDPKEAYSVKPAGDYKGFALALLIEILCGSLEGVKMGINTGVTGSSFGTKLPDRGAVIMVFDPSLTTNLADFKTENSELLDNIASSSPLKNQKIRIPGEQAAKLQKKRMHAGSIEIPDELWQEIQNLKV